MVWRVFYFLNLLNSWRKSHEIKFIKKHINLFNHLIFLIYTKCACYVFFSINLTVWLNSRSSHRRADSWWCFRCYLCVGTGAAGQIGITGSLTYDNSTPVFQQVVASNGNGQSNFLAPITGLQLTIGGTPVNANIASINANNASSALGVGMDVASANPDTCLGYLADCAASFPSLAMTQTSNTAFIHRFFML